VATEEVFRSFFRPFASGEAALPVSVRSAGFYSVGPGWHDTPMKKPFCEIFWCVSGRGRFELDGRRLALSPGEVMVLFPGEWHRIGSEGRWSYHWMTFDGPLAEDLFRRIPVSSRVLKAGPCPRDLFERSESLLQSPDVRSQCMATAAGLEIICPAMAGTAPQDVAASPSDEEDALFKTALKIIDENWQDSSFDVTRLAQRLGMHRTTLSKLFMRRLKTPPLKYLKAKRLQKALMLVKGSRMQVREMAGLCGFTSPEYFTRTLRRATGMTPGQLRRGYGH